MRLALNRVYEMEAAHRLTAGVPEGHQCRRSHGHRYRLTVSVSGDIGNDGMVLEYGQLDEWVLDVTGLVDHYDLNTLDERDRSSHAQAVAANPTVERILSWMLERLMSSQRRPGVGIRLDALQLEEDSRSSAKWSLS